MADLDQILRIVCFYPLLSNRESRQLPVLRGFTLVDDAFNATKQGKQV
jgi:hypothetical protein